MARRNRKAALSPKSIVLAKAETSDALLKPQSDDRVRAVLSGRALDDPRLEAEREAFLVSDGAQEGGFVSETVADELRFLSAREAENFERYRRDPVAFAKAVLGDREARPWQSLVSQVPPKLDWSDEVFMAGAKTRVVRERFSVKVPISDPATWVKPRTAPEPGMRGRTADLMIVDDVEPVLPEGLKLIDEKDGAGTVKVGDLEFSVNKVTANQMRRILSQRAQRRADARAEAAATFLGRAPVMSIEVEAEPENTDAFFEAYERFALEGGGSPDRVDAVMLAFAKEENKAMMRDTRLIEGAGTDWIPVAGFDPGAAPVADGTGPRVNRVVGASSTPCPRCGTSSQCVARIERTEERTDPFQPFKSMARDRGPTLYFVECGFCGYGERGIATAISTDRQPGSAFEVFRIAAEVKMVRGLASDELIPGDVARGLDGIAGDLAAAQRRLEEIEALPPNTPIPTRDGVVTQEILRARLIEQLEAPDQVSGRLERDEMGNLILPQPRGSVAARAGQIVSRKYGREQGCPSCGARPDRVNTTGREDRQRTRYALVCGACDYSEKGEVINWTRSSMQVNITATGSALLCPTEGCNARLSREGRFAASYLVCPLCRWEMAESEYRRIVQNGGMIPRTSAEALASREAAALGVREAASRTSRAEAERAPDPRAQAAEPADVRGERAFSWDDQ